MLLYEQPENAFVAQFIGENNRLTGTVKAVNGLDCDVEVETGEIIKSLAVNINGVGSKTTLSLRPERVIIGAEPGTCPNNINGTVRELIYLGDHIRARLALCGQEEFIVKVPNSSRHTQLSEGESVNVSWHSVDCRALDAQS